MSDFSYNPDQVAQALSIVDAFVARSLSRGATTLDVEAIKGTARQVALQALRRFDPLKGCSLATWLIYQVKFGIRQELRRQDYLPRRRRQKVKQLQAMGLEEAEWEKAPRSLSEPVTDGEGPAFLEDQIPDTRPTTERLIISREFAIYLEAMMDQLPREEQEILRRHYWDEETTYQMACRLGWTKRRVERLLRNGERHLRHLLEADGIHDTMD